MNTVAQASGITLEQKQAADQQIRTCRRRLDYDTKDLTIESLVSKFREGLLFIPPDYQGDSWDERHQNLFLESFLLDIPVSSLFLADCPDGRLEVVDGAQRIRTIAAFHGSTLRMSGLDTLTALSGFTYADLSDAQQRWFLSRSVRAVVFERGTSAASRRDLAYRMNQPRIQKQKAHIEEEEHAMPEDALNMLDTIAYCIWAFAQHYGLTQQEAYRYLRQYGGIPFLQKFYDIEGTLWPDEVAEDLTAICSDHGGTLA